MWWQLSFVHLRMHILSVTVFLGVWILLGMVSCLLPTAVWKRDFQFLEGCHSLLGSSLNKVKSFALMWHFLYKIIWLLLNSIILTNTFQKEYTFFKEYFDSTGFISSDCIFLLKIVNLLKWILGLNFYLLSRSVGFKMFLKWLECCVFL